MFLILLNCTNLKQKSMQCVLTAKSYFYLYASSVKAKFYVLTTLS